MDLRWFKFEVDAGARLGMDAKLPGATWYSRLGAVATSILRELVHIHLEFQDVNGRSVKWNEQTIRNTMMRVPTPPSCTGEYDAFRINTAPSASGFYIS